MKAESHFSRNKKQHDLLKPFIIKGHAEVDAEVACLRMELFIGILYREKETVKLVKTSPHNVHRVCSNAIANYVLYY